MEEGSGIQPPIDAEITNHAKRLGLRLSESPNVLETIIIKGLVREIYNDLKRVWNIHREHNLEGNPKSILDKEGTTAELSRHQSREGFVDFAITLRDPNQGNMKFVLTEDGVGFIALVPNENLTDGSGESLKPFIKTLDSGMLFTLGIIAGGMAEDIVKQSQTPPATSGVSR